MSGADIATEVAGGVAALGLIGGLIKYRMDRRIGVAVMAKSDCRLRQAGIGVEVRNTSTQRQAKVKDVEVLHSRGLLRGRSAVSTGPFIEPLTPWVLGVDDSKDGWVALTAVNGSENGLKEATYDFSRAVKVRVKVVGRRRGRTSRRFKVEQAA
jgi:hypothetical protein